MNKYLPLLACIFLCGFTDEPIYPVLADELTPGTSLQDIREPSASATATSNSNPTLTNQTYSLPLPTVALDEPISIEDNVYMTAELVSDPVVQPVVEQPVQQSVTPVEKPIIKQPLVTPIVPQPVVKPGVKQPVVEQPVMPTEKPMVKQPLVTPTVPQPVVKPGVQQPVVEPVLKKPSVKVVPPVEAPVKSVPQQVQSAPVPERVPTNVTPSNNLQAALERHRTSQSSLEEYVNRVAKRLLLVSMRPELNYLVRVTEDSGFTIGIDMKSLTITLSRSLLNELNDEAELAATLALVMGSMERAVELDREAANTMYRAGYDPAALIELQEAYFYSELEHQQHWLSQLYPNGISASKIMANKVMVTKMPIGLMRGAQSYQEHIQG